MMDQRMELRPVSVADLPFLTEMTLLAAFPPGPSPEGASDMPHVTRWTVDWGRPGDVGVVAWSDGQRLGAAWCRLQADALARSDAGDPLPEVAIAVLPEHRARGIGTQMLTALDRAAAAGGQRALSLTVNALNPALHLYERAGFDVVLREGDRLTMVRLLVTPGPDTAPVSSAGARVGPRRNPSPKAHTPAVAEGNGVPDEATPMGSLPRLVIFDLDNTLANRQRFFGEWAAALIRERHLDPETALTILQDADEDGVAPRTVFFEQVRARLGLAEPVDDLTDTGAIR
jgi:GNAT superfamily N-acetyltransferase